MFSPIKSTFFLWARAVSKVHSHFPARMSEWGLGYIMLSWGVLLILNPRMFEQGGDIYGGFGYEQAHWAALAVIIGAVRLVALFVNGASQRTPTIRAAVSVASAVMWVHILNGFFASYLESGLVHTGFAVYPWFVLGDIYNAYRAGMDARVAAENEKVIADVFGTSRRRSA